MAFGWYRWLRSVDPMDGNVEARPNMEVVDPHPLVARRLARRLLAAQLFEANWAVWI